MSDNRLQLFPKNAASFEGMRFADREPPNSGTNGIHSYRPGSFGPKTVP